MSSPYALARERLKTIAETVTGLSGKCAVLAGRESADVEAWRRYTPSGLLFLAVGESALAPGGIDTPGTIAVYLYAQTDANGEALDDLLDALRDKWLDASNYPGGELACQDLSFEPAVTLCAEPSRAFLCVRITCYFAAE